MNGAVAGSMRYYGADYGLNYGVSLPTIRSLAELEGKDHTYSKYLFQQQVREIQLASLHIAEPHKISESELDFWAAGIINSEIAEEAAFALFQYVEYATLMGWLSCSNELLVYTALLSISKNKKVDINSVKQLVISNINNESLLIITAIVTLLESYYRDENNQPIIDEIINSLPSTKAAEEIKSEMEWRCICYK